MKGAVIYISSNRENPKFESKIIEDMLGKRGDLSVYAVTQKGFESFKGATELFEGIPDLYETVIGDVGTSGFNFCRQLQMVVEMAKVDYVISCEADCLYSPDYFEFIPPRLDTVYRNTNNYVLPYKKDYWHPKNSQTAFQIAGRDFLLDRLNFLLKDQPEWDMKQKNFPKEIGLPFLEGWEEFKTINACFGIKTGKGMRNHTASGSDKVYDLPYWGKAVDVRKEYSI